MPGKRWIRQLDGRGLGDVLVPYYTKRGDAKWLAEARRFAAQGAENPFLDVWFDDDRTGFVVGAFGLLLRTGDGGRTWEPLMHAADNPKSLHLYAARRVGGELFVVGEQGLAMKWDGARFAALTLPYAGTLFGLVGKGRTVIAHGLRGNVVRSADGRRHLAERGHRRHRSASPPAPSTNAAASSSSAGRDTCSPAATTARAFLP
jgi:photosystem II stability/assembly factor-like uncharacterized protein